ncbi:geranylgeranylglyceryl/heptaprenylglyceryl phosphate synthase [Gangjinia marincola]|uniref:Geranylgeranylglyceryl phosphate synthase n=1 Tax=Gangjinia marincola TaxID=578463 RepID=A0ABN1MHD7_9FLAO
MGAILKKIQQAGTSGTHLLAILIDPEKFENSAASDFLSQLPKETTHFFIGGSSCTAAETQRTVSAIKKKTTLPVVLFPGAHHQLSKEADAILFLSLVSGRNPVYLIDQHIKSVSALRTMNIEIISTGYLLIDGGHQSAIERVSETSSMAQSDVQLIVDTALAAQFQGKQLIYLEAGSGALKTVSEEIITAVKKEISIPLIVGGGVTSANQLAKLYHAGADMVVVGTAFETGNWNNTITEHASSKNKNYERI